MCHTEKNERVENCKGDVTHNSSIPLNSSRCLKGLVDLHMTMNRQKALQASGTFSESPISPLILYVTIQEVTSQVLSREFE